MGPTGVGAASGPGRKTFLFVHGACAAALNARYPSSYLRNDAAALATEVSPIAGIHLEDYRKAVADQVTELARRAGRQGDAGRSQLRRPHDHAGRRIGPAPHRAPRVPRSAYVPVAFPNGAAYGALPEGRSGISGAVIVADPATTGAMRINSQPRPGVPREGPAAPRTRRSRPRCRTARSPRPTRPPRAMKLPGAHAGVEPLAVRLDARRPRRRPRRPVAMRWRADLPSSIR